MALETSVKRAALRRRSEGLSHGAGSAKSVSQLSTSPIASRSWPRSSGNTPRTPVVSSLSRGMREWIALENPAPRMKARFMVSCTSADVSPRYRPRLAKLRMIQYRTRERGQCGTMTLHRHFGLVARLVLAVPTSNTVDLPVRRSGLGTRAHLMPLLCVHRRRSARHRSVALSGDQLRPLSRDRPREPPCCGRQGSSVDG